MKPCADTPEQLWISDFHEARPGAYHTGNPRFPWSPALLAHAVSLRQAGESWGRVARALQEATGVLLSERAVGEYVARHWRY